MALPVAYFGYSKNGLEVNFTNLSLKSPTSYEWDFGDGGNSVLKDPTHTYTNPGFYSVTLKVTNTEGVGEPLTLTVGVGDNNDMMNASILELVDYYIPTLLRGEATTTEIASFIIRWQLYLQPLVEIPYPVSDNDTHNEFKWPGLANALIAQLVAYDIILQGANQFLSSSFKEGITEEEAGSDEEIAPQQIKSIETGPAKTEWFQNKELISDSEKIKNIGAAVASAMKAGGALDQLKEAICQQASRLRVYLPMCGQLSHSPAVPSVARKPKTGSHAANPFGITKRMT